MDVAVMSEDVVEMEEDLLVVVMIVIAAGASVVVVVIVIMAGAQVAGILLMFGAKMEAEDRSVGNISRQADLRPLAPRRTVVVV